MADYNGVTLPDIPSDALQYQLILKGILPNGILYLVYTSSEPLYVALSETHNADAIFVKEGALCGGYSFNDVDTWNTFGEPEEAPSDSAINAIGIGEDYDNSIIWANFDIPYGSPDSTDIYFPSSVSNILYSIKESTLKGIANSIRSKTGKTDSILTENMASEIEGISSGGIEGGYNVTFNDENEELLALYSIKQGHSINPPNYTCKAWKTEESEIVEFPYTPTTDITLIADNSTVAKLLYDYYGVDAGVYHYVIAYMYKTKYIIVCFGTEIDEYNRFINTYRNSTSSAGAFTGTTAKEFAEHVMNYVDPSLLTEYSNDYCSFDDSIISGSSTIRGTNFDFAYSNGTTYDFRE